VSMQVTDLVTKPLDKRSHNFIFFMLRRYYYHVNPSCAMAAQGMKTFLWGGRVRLGKKVCNAPPATDFREERNPPQADSIVSNIYLGLGPI
jgi:hypothetical protein